MKKLLNYIFGKTIKKITCEHEFILNGWTSVKCKKCDYVSRDMSLYNDVYDNRLNRRAEGLRKAGFSEDYILQDNAKIKPF